MSVAISLNQTKNSSDMYIRASTKFNNGQGWLGLGTGMQMRGSQMVVLYPGSGREGSF